MITGKVKDLWDQMEVGDRIETKIYNGTSQSSLLKPFKGIIASKANGYIKINGISGWLETGLEGNLEVKILNKNNNKNMDLKQWVSEKFTKEPLKSFIKVGLKTKDDQLTDEGKEIFLNLLAKRKENEEELLNEIAKPMLAEEKK